jgi:hypothetical protein
MTYIWTTEGWLYLAVIIDLFSRRVVGWSMAEHMRTELVLTALEAALGQRQPAPSGLAGLQHRRYNFRKPLQMTLVFGLHPLTQLVLQLTIQEGCFHETGLELGNSSLS